MGRLVVDVAEGAAEDGLNPVGDDSQVDVVEHRPAGSGDACQGGGSGPIRRNGAWVVADKHLVGVGVGVEAQTSDVDSRTSRYAARSRLHVGRRVTDGEQLERLAGKCHRKEQEKHK